MTRPFGPVTLVLVALAAVAAPGLRLGAQAPDLEVLPVQHGVYLVAGAGGNVVAQVGRNGVLLVDAGAPDTDGAVRTALDTLTPAPVRYIINTSGDLDHTGGNAPLATSGANASVNVPGNSGFAIQTAPIIAREAVYLAMGSPGADGQPARPFDAWPTSTFFTPLKTMVFDDQPIEIHAAPAAHTDGDLFVFFRQADVIAAGDLYVTDTYPVIELARGGSIQGLIDAANHLIAITIPRFNQQGGTLVVPGHGRLSNEADVVEYRDMITIVRDRVQRRLAAGARLADVLADGVTLDYDGVYDDPGGPWTAGMFVEAVYRSLAP
jgi:cyclase